MALPSIDAGRRDKRVTFQNPGDPVPDGEGGYTEGWVTLTPAVMMVEIKPASAADLERVASGTVSASATHVIKGPFHPDVSTKSRVLWTDLSGRPREFSVAGKVNPLEQNRDMVLVCEEKVD